MCALEAVCLSKIHQDRIGDREKVPTKPEQNPWKKARNYKSTGKQSPTNTSAEEDEVTLEPEVLRNDEGIVKSSRSKNSSLKLKKNHGIRI